MGKDAQRRMMKKGPNHSAKKRFRKAAFKLMEAEMKGPSPCYESILNILSAHKNNLVAYENMRIDQEERKWAIVKGIGKNTPTKENLFGLIF